MKTTMTMNKHAVIIVAGIALIISGLFLYKNISLRNQLLKEKIRSEALLSQKLELEKSMDRIRRDLALMQGKSANPDHSAKETNDKIAESRKRY